MQTSLEHSVLEGKLQIYVAIFDQGRMCTVQIH